MLEGNLAVGLRKSSETSLPSATTRNGPKRIGGGRPKISARNVADFCLSRHQTMV